MWVLPRNPSDLGANERELEVKDLDWRRLGRALKRRTKP